MTLQRFDRWHPGTPEERFWAKVLPGPSGCWEWLAGRNEGGYGLLGVDGFMTRAHRFAYELLVKPIPDGLHIDHLCRNRGCVNPLHLEPVTNQVNILRGHTVPARNLAKTRCKNGHEFTPENTYIRVRREGGRECRTCVQDRKKRGRVK